MPNSRSTFPAHFPRALLAWAVLIGPVLAADLWAAEMQEIVVSSGLRDSNLTQSASSITVIEKDAIDASSIQHFEELIRLVPNLNWSGEGARARYFQLRGIGELEQYEGAPNPSLGFLVDDMDFSGIGGASTLFDMQQVEVLRGPQGTRFGANALAGLVYLRSVDPSPELNGRIEATTGNDDTFALGAAIGGPVGGTDGRLQYRLAVQQFGTNGFRDNVFLGRDDTYERDEFTGRAKLRWIISDTWQADLTGIFVDLDNGYDGFSVDNGFETFSDKPGEDRQQSAGGSLRITGTLAEQRLEVVSLTSFVDSQIDFSFDADWGNDEFWNTPRFANAVYDYFSARDRSRQTFTQELRLLSGEQGRLFRGTTAWVVGAYFQRYDEDNQVIDFGRDNAFPTPPCFGGAVQVNDPLPRCRSDFNSAYDADRVALFGELEVELSDRTALVVGLRGERGDAGYRDSAWLSFGPTDDLWGGDVSLRYQLNEMHTAYGRIARGYRASGFNLNTNVPDDLVQFGREALLNYELGLRGASDDGRWSYDLSLFLQDRRDAQVKIPLQDALGNPIAFNFLTTNAESGRNIGAEFQGRYALTPSAVIRGSVGLLDAEIDRFSYDPLLEGRDAAHAPDYTFAIGARLTRPDGWFLDVEVEGKDAFFFDFSHDQRSDAYELVNLSLGRQWDRLRITGWARNLFDRSYAVRGFFFGNEPPLFPETLYLRLGDRRQVGVTVTFDY